MAESAATKMSKIISVILSVVLATFVVGIVGVNGQGEKAMDGPMPVTILTDMARRESDHLVL